MSNIPARPDTEPDKWLMVFDYFDKMTCDCGLSQPTACDDQASARACASQAPGHHDGAGITVLRSYVYPPVGDDTPVAIYSFTRH